MAGPVTPEDEPWHDYAERWGTDQYEESIWTPRREAIANAVALVYMVIAAPIVIWSLLVDLGLVN